MYALMKTSSSSENGNSNNPNGPLGFVVGSLGFEPRIACAPGMYPSPS
jgi:hypothetical protein